MFSRITRYSRTSRLNYRLEERNNSRDTPGRTINGASVYNLALSDGKLQSSRPINRPTFCCLNSLICDDYARPGN